jgi:hypothetical protein
VDVGGPDITARLDEEVATAREFLERIAAKYLG